MNFPNKEKIYYMPLDELFASTDYKIWKKTSLGFSYAYQNRNDISCHGTLTTLEKKFQDQKNHSIYFFTVYNSFGGRTFKVTPKFHICCIYPIIQ